MINNNPSIVMETQLWIPHLITWLFFWLVLWFTQEWVAE